MGNLGETLIKIGAISEDNLIGVLAEQMGVEMLGAADFPEDSNQIGQAITGLDLAPRWLRAKDAVIWCGSTQSRRGHSVCRKLASVVPGASRNY